MIRNIILSIQSLIKNGSVADNLTAQYKQEQKQHEFLTQKYYYVNNVTYIEKQAREKLGLTKKNEYVILLPTPTPSKVPGNEQHQKQNWVKWWNLFF